MVCRRQRQSKSAQERLFLSFAHYLSPTAYPNNPIATVSESRNQECNLDHDERSNPTPYEHHKTCENRLSHHRLTNYPDWLYITLSIPMLNIGQRKKRTLVAFTSQRVSKEIIRVDDRDEDIPRRANSWFGRVECRKSHTSSFLARMDNVIETSPSILMCALVLCLAG